MHIIENQYLGLALKNPARAAVLKDAAVFAANAYAEAVGVSEVATKRDVLNRMLLFLLNPYTPNYLLTEPAQQVISRIKVGDLFDIEILRTLPENKTLFYNFLVGKDRVLYCEWNKNELYVIDLQRYADSPAIKRSVSLISLTASPKLFDPTTVEAIRCLMFLNLTAPELIQLAAGKKLGTRAQGHYNATSLPVVLVDSTWNKYLVRTEGFEVSGHFRLQRCGPGNAELKLTWIKPYQKHGYVRLPKTEGLPKETA
ncbi:hypothetical protein GO988_23295 [Hymenobacter sp. HMF4947]|uniref:Uncharacterized protein n=1 Tax=Hymenobacter ginkgonis TaxID=2682976 RepID=A0A7K1TLH4_9BACT|nr:hypothetical protein [Hymenobacter ginkgonis]MVN79269.1 hypothetical protein [Hymenobacter ginkgonis]